MSNIVFIGSLPPPVNGLALANQATIESLAIGRNNLRVLNTAPVVNRGRVFYHLSRVWRNLGAAGWLARHPDIEVVYLPVDGGFGLAYGIVIGWMLNLLRKPIVAHHHSFAYISRPSPLMRIFLRTAGDSQLHVFLCEDMRTAFLKAYPLAAIERRAAFVLPNSFMIENYAHEPITRSIGEAIVIGHLSNLGFDKGTDLFLDVFEAIAGCEPRIGARLAGPVYDSGLKIRIRDLENKYPERFFYDGPIYGAAKQAFLDLVDIFVFPTRYRNEAQPLVLIEALASGCVLATISRGCIGCDHRASGAFVAEDEERFASEVPGWILETCRTPGRLNVLRREAGLHSQHLNELAKVAKHGWLEAIARLRDNVWNV